MTNLLPHILPLSPNRVRRNYHGGYGLDLLASIPEPQDSNRPEDWLCSLTEAINPGQEAAEGEGLSRIQFRGEEVFIRDLFKENPAYYLGEKHYQKHGLQMGFLTKLLDSSMRLHLQAHPTREFAQKEWGKPWGKFECYVILSVRESVDPYIYLGFQHSPGAEEWLRIVREQDKDAMLACFEKIPVAVGEVWYVPGGYPHALGEGLTVIEVMEPSDLVVRCEFEREGIVVPPDARFMGRDPKEAMRIFDYTELPKETVTERYRVSEKIIQESPQASERLCIGAEQIDCFEVRELEVRVQSFDYAKSERFMLGVVVGGEGELSAGGERLALSRGKTFFIPAGVSSVQFSANTSEPLKLNLCFPGAIS